MIEYTAKADGRPPKDLAARAVDKNIQAPLHAARCASCGDCMLAAGGPMSAECILMTPVEPMGDRGVQCDRVAALTACLPVV